LIKEFFPRKPSRCCSTRSAVPQGFCSDLSHSAKRMIINKCGGFSHCSRVKFKKILSDAGCCTSISPAFVLPSDFFEEGEHDSAIVAAHKRPHVCISHALTEAELLAVCGSVSC